MLPDDPNQLTALQILIYLRQRLQVAIEQNDKGELQDLVKVFSMLWDVVDRNNIPGSINGVIENLTNTTIDYAHGEGWKAIFPSEEEIRSAFPNMDTKS